MTARKPARLWEMAELVAAEARRIRIVQEGLVREGVRKEPHAGMIRNAEIFEDIERLLLAIEPVRKEVHRVIAPVIKAMATRDNFKKPEPGPEAPAAAEDISDD